MAGMLPPIKTFHCAFLVREINRIYTLKGSTSGITYALSPSHERILHHPSKYCVEIAQKIVGDEGKSWVGNMVCETVRCAANAGLKNVLLVQHLTRGIDVGVVEQG